MSRRSMEMDIDPEKKKEKMRRDKEDTYPEGRESQRLQLSSKRVRGRGTMSDTLVSREIPEKGKKEDRVEMKMDDTYLREEKSWASSLPINEVLDEVSIRGPKGSIVEGEKEKDKFKESIIGEIMKQLKKYNYNNDEKGLKFQEVDQTSSPLPQRKPRIRVMSDVQLVPSREMAPAHRTMQTPGIPGRTGVSGGEADDSNSEWSTAGKRKKKKRRERGETRPYQQSESVPLSMTDTYGDSNKGYPLTPRNDIDKKMDGKRAGTPKNVEKETPRRRVPRGATVAIRGVVEGFSYAEAMRTAKNKISLEELGIKNTKIRKTVGGALLIEVPGPDGGNQAERLKEELTKVLEGSAVVTRPVACGDIRVIGVDESVTSNEVAAVVANVSGCSVENVKTSPMRYMNNGLLMTWVRLLLAAAIKVSNIGRLNIGWTVARVELLNVKPTQCYKCWAFGHMQTRCTSETDRRGACFRCGESGHKSKECASQIRCVLCAEAGRSAQHRMGAIGCSSLPGQIGLNRRQAEVSAVTT